MELVLISELRLSPRVGAGSWSARKLRSWYSGGRRKYSKVRYLAALADNNEDELTS